MVEEEILSIVDDIVPYFSRTYDVSGEELRKAMERSKNNQMGK